MMTDRTKVLKLISRTPCGYLYSNSELPKFNTLFLVDFRTKYPVILQLGLNHNIVCLVWYVKIVLLDSVSIDDLWIHSGRPKNKNILYSKFIMYCQIY